MKKIYVAGPYSANNVVDVLKNIGKGRKACADLFAMGFYPFCPWHDATFIIDNPECEFNVQKFREYSIEWLKVSDTLVYLENSENSNGVQAEIALAKKTFIPVFAYDEFVKKAKTNGI